MFIIKLLKPISMLLTYVKYKIDRLHLKKLINQGLKIGRNVYIQRDVDIDDNYPFLIEIEDNCRISMGVRILAHDATTFKDLGVTRIAPIKILEGTFIGERAIILPGVTIGPRAIIAAGTVVNRDIGEGKIAAGNPGRPYGVISDIFEKTKNLVNSKTIFKRQDIDFGKITYADICLDIKKNLVAFIYGIPTKDPYYVNEDLDELRETTREAFTNLIKNT